MKKSGRYRAKLKAKKRKERLRKRGFLKVRVAGKRMKPVKRASKHKQIGFLHQSQKNTKSMLHTQIFFCYNY